MKLRELMIFVSDLGRAKAFYRDVLGFGLVSEGGGHVVFSYANGTLTVYPCEKDGSPGDYANEARSVFVFEVASIDAVMADLQRQGVRFLHATPAQNEAGRYAAFVDPFGNVHELFEAHAA